MKDKLKKKLCICGCDKEMPLSQQASNQIYDKFFEITKRWRTIKGYSKQDFWKYLDNKLQELGRMSKS